ncbi:MAG: hypothetical protein PHW64_01995 [Sulfuricurvum sp.]|nr:hypothetical protein [Sulfuricurvum sp.]
MIRKWLWMVGMTCGGVFFMGTADWFSQKSAEIASITDTYRQDIAELKKIRDINLWLKQVIIPHFSAIPETQSDAEIAMIRFYDRYSKTFNFKVSKFIYYDTAAKMDLGFSFRTHSQEDIDRLLSLRFEGGFIQIQTLEIRPGEMNGILTLIQPIQGEINVP